MEFKKFKTEDEASKYVADLILEELKQNSKLKLGLATGSTPIKLYNNLSNDYKINKTNWSSVLSFNLDEYLGIDKNDPQSYQTFMNEHLFSNINISIENTHFPKIGIDYDELINKNGGIDIQILGIGTNGHIGFNEPGSSLDSKTRIVDLTQETIQVNADKFFDGDQKQVPKQAISMGIDSILKAKKIILLAFGASKKWAISKLKSIISFDSNFPASSLILHKDVLVVTDSEAELDL